MHKVAVFLAVPALLLAGCSSAPQDAQPSASLTAATATPTTALPTHTATAKTREEQINDVYLDSLYKSDAALKSADRADLISIGKGFCKMYDGGAKGSDINSYILKAAGFAYTVKQLVAIHGSAVGAYCPEYISKMGS